MRLKTYLGSLIFRQLIVLCFFILACSESMSVLANGKKESERPRIGLVLSGGGAKGLAHIGVIKVLEEYGLRPDVITGTSMGSIIGGLYAAGYSAQELHEITTGVDWSDILSDESTSLKQVIMEEKGESGKYLLHIPVKDRKLNLPSGLIQGQNLETYLAELFWPLTSSESFDSLPIPFHCMSVDILSGQAIEHSSGDIVKSIRASMAIPTVFSPVKMDSMYLVDGGVLNNFPVQEARRMGADFIIGVYVSFEDEVSADELSSMPDVLFRTAALSGIVSAIDQFDDVDLLIVPDLHDYGTEDFGKAQILEQIGEEAARNQKSELRSLSDRLGVNATSELTKKRKDKIKIGEIEVENLEYMSRDFIISKAGIKAGDEISFQDINEAIEYLYGTQYFQKITYSLKKESEGNEYTLVFHAVENSRFLIKLAPNYDYNLGPALVTNLTIRNVLLPSSRMLLTGSISENPGIKMELDRFIDWNERFSHQLGFDGYLLKMPYYKNGQRMGSYDRPFLKAWYGIRFTPDINTILGPDIFYRNNTLEPEADLRMIHADLNFKKYKSNEYGYSLNYQHNRTNNLYFPTEGYKLEMRFDHVLNSADAATLAPGANPSDVLLLDFKDQYVTLSVDYEGYKPITRKLTFNIGGSVGLNSEKAGFLGQFFLGGTGFYERSMYNDLTGFNLGEIITSNFVTIHSGLSMEVLNDIHVFADANVFEIGNSYDALYENIVDLKFNTINTGFGGGIKYESILGPIQLMLSGNSWYNDVRVHLSMGFPF